MAAAHAFGMEKGAHRLGCALRQGLCLMGCCFLLDGCAPKTQPPPVEEPVVEYVYVLGPATMMLYLDETNPPMLASEGTDEDLPVFASREDARQWLETEVSANRLAPDIWRVYRLEGTWGTDVVQAENGEPRMRHPARLYPVI